MKVEVSRERKRDKRVEEEVLPSDPKLQSEQKLPSEGRKDGVEGGGDGLGEPLGGQRHRQRAQYRHRDEEGLHSAQP